MPQQSKFDAAATRLSLLNALFLVDMADLAYNDLNIINKHIIDELGFIKYKPFDSHDTQAFVCANDDIIVVAFRGTESINDWLTDLKIKLVRSAIGYVHYGFNEALNWVWTDLKQVILDFMDKGQTVWITGHSLGGALATLAADRLTDESVNVNGLYTFGQPRVGDKAFVSNFNDKMEGCTFRFVHDEDAVPKFPKFIQGYRHIEKEYFFDREGALYTNRIWLYKLMSRCTSVAIRSSEDADKLKIKNPNGLRDHGLGYYKRCIQANYIEQKGGPDSFLEYINS